MPSKDYRTLMEREHVLVKVPKEGPYMSDTPAHSFQASGKIINVPRHWQNGLLVPDTDIILNRHFYGFQDFHLGQEAVATVRVVEKSTHDRKFIMLDISREPDGSRPTCELKFLPEPGDIRILGSRTWLHFRPLPAEQVAEALVETSVETAAEPPAEITPPTTPSTQEAEFVTLQQLQRHFQTKSLR